jgi:hypothetical protein
MAASVSALLALDRGTDFAESFVVDETAHAVSLCEAFDELFAMLIDASNQIARYADVERAPDLAGEDIDVIDALPHKPILAFTGLPGQAGR